MFFYRNDIVKEKPETMLDFYKLLPKYGKKGRTNLMDGAEEVVPLALMALGLDPNTDKPADFKKAEKFLLGIRRGVTTITSSNYINDGSAGKIILGQGWNGDVRRIVTARKKQGDITAVIPHGRVREVGRQLVHPRDAPASEGRARVDQLPAARRTSRRRRWTTTTTRSRCPEGLALVPEVAPDRPMFNVPTSYTNGYHFILNPTPEIVNEAHGGSTRSSRPRDRRREGGGPSRPVSGPRGRSFKPRYPRG